MEPNDMKPKDVKHGMRLSSDIDSSDADGRVARIEFARWVLDMKSTYGIQTKDVLERVGRSKGRVSTWIAVVEAYGPALTYEVVRAWDIDALHAWRPERSNMSVDEVLSTVRARKDAPRVERASSDSTASSTESTTVSASGGVDPTVTFTVARRTFTALMSAKRDTESWDDLFGRLLTGNADAMMPRGVVQGNAPSRDTRKPGRRNPDSTTKGNAPRERA